MKFLNKKYFNLISKDYSSENNQKELLIYGNFDCLFYFFKQVFLVIVQKGIGRTVLAQKDISFLHHYGLK